MRAIEWFLLYHTVDPIDMVAEEIRYWTLINTRQLSGWSAVIAMRITAAGASAWRMFDSYSRLTESRVFVLETETDNHISPISGAREAL